MIEKANHSIVVGKGADAKTVAAGEPLPDLPADEIKRLREIGAIGNQAPGAPPADAEGPLVPAGTETDAGDKKKPAHR